MVKATMEIRTKSVVLYTEGVYSAEEIGRMFDVSERTLRRWRAAYDNGGFEALRPKKTGPKSVEHAIPKQRLRYSDPEKTVLDFIHVWRYNGIPRERIIMDLSDYAKGTSKKEIMEYARKYSKSVKEMAEEVIG